MRSRALLVAHHSTMVAEGLAAGLSRYPELSPVATATTAIDTERLANAAKVEVAVIDAAMAGAEDVARSLRRRGIRVVLVGEPVGDEDERQDVRVSPRASLATLAAAAEPGMRRGRNGHEGLTTRERQVLSLVGRGLPGKQVARHLGISPKTVEHHKTRIFSKLGVANQTAATRLAVEHELGGYTRWTQSNI